MKETWKDKVIAVVLLAVSAAFVVICDLYGRGCFNGICQ